MRFILMLALLLPSLAFAQGAVSHPRDGRGDGRGAEVHSRDGEPRRGVRKLLRAYEEQVGLQRALVGELRELAPASSNRAVAAIFDEKLADLMNSQARVDEIVGRLAELARQPVVVERFVEVPVEVLVEPPPPPQPQPATPQRFDRIVSAVEAQSFADDRLQTLRSAAVDDFFVVAQVRRLMSCFSFDERKVEVAAMLFNRTLDPENWFEVYEDLSFSSSKDELRRRVGR